MDNCGKFQFSFKPDHSAESVLIKVTNDMLMVSDHSQLHLS